MSETLGSRAGPSLDSSRTGDSAGEARGAVQAGPNPERLQPAGLAAIANIGRDTRRAPEVDATPEALGNHVINGMTRANTTAAGLVPRVRAGIHYAENFKSSWSALAAMANLNPAKPDRDVIAKVYGDSNPFVDTDGKLDTAALTSVVEECKAALSAAGVNEWTHDMEHGYANPQYWRRLSHMKWVLRPGQRASEAIKAWIDGPTVAECLSAAQIMLVDAYRAAIGNDAFDARFGDGTASTELLVVGVDCSPLTSIKHRPTLAAEASEIGNRPLAPGDWCYFSNHPKYMLKHPAGAWQGENAFYVGMVNGQQIFSGLGVSGVSEDKMLDELVEAYNAPRSDTDEELAFRGGAEFDPKRGGFPDQITKQELLAAAPYEVLGKTRKGGFVPESVVRLDAAAIQQQRSQGSKVQPER